MEYNPFIIVPLMLLCGLVTGVALGVFLSGKKNEDAEGLVRIGASRISGRGAFAVKDINRGTIIERCPALEVNDGDIGGELLNYVFYGKKDTTRLVVMGNGMLFNHSSEPNVAYYLEETKLGPELVLYALREISQGEELFYNYGDEWWKTRN